MAEWHVSVPAQNWVLYKRLRDFPGFLMTRCDLGLVRMAMATRMSVNSDAGNFRIIKLITHVR